MTPAAGRLHYIRGLYGRGVENDEKWLKTGQYAVLSGASLVQGGWRGLIQLAGETHCR